MNADALIAALEQIKILHAELATVSADVVATRETLAILVPEFDPLFQKKRMAIVQSKVANVQAQASLIDGLIRQSRTQ